MSGWNLDTLARTAGPGAVTIVAGSSFCISRADGDIEADRPHGVFFRDTRLLSTWSLLINDAPVEQLSALTPQPHRAIFVGRAAHLANRSDAPLIVERERHVGSGLREDITLRNFSREPVSCTLDLGLASDFADIFEVKEGRPRAKWNQTIALERGLLRVDSAWHSEHRGISVLAPDAEVTAHRLRYRIVVPPQGQWSTTITVTPTVDGEAIATSFPADQPLRQSEPQQRFLDWQARIPTPSFETAAILRVINRSEKDLGSLRIIDPNHPDRDVIAAGAPWFMALFGRDSLLTSWMALPVDPALALGTLQTLAEFQGVKVSPETEEQPGRILHEVRLGVASDLALGGGNIYYGTADATPLFVCLLGELYRWGLSAENLAELLPHADRALAWIDQFGDQDGDGFVEYERLNPQGLLNQGWKDSLDGINFADGTLAEGPIALCEVQGYVYQAYLARALIARGQGDWQTSENWTHRAAALKRAFNDKFWLPQQGYFAIALDRDKRPVDGCASNMGHCLWSGIIDEDKASLVAARLLSPEMFTGWGVRTLASDMGAYNPASYHNGSVWPHDNALIVAGLMRYGFVEEAQKIVFGLLAAADFFGGRLPELFCGFDQTAFEEPVPYPNSCSPQAWAAATPFLLLRSLLRFDPCIPDGELWLAPVMSDRFGRFQVDNVPLADAKVSMTVVGNRVTVTGLGEGVTVRHEPRPLGRDGLDGPGRLAERR